MKMTLVAEICTILLVATTPKAGAGQVDFQHRFGIDQEYVDVFLTPTIGAEFTNFDLVVTFFHGGLLDPVRNQPSNSGNFDSVVDGARLDTWANTPFSALGAGTPSYVFTKYHPGVSPFFPPDPLPGAGHPNTQLYWTVFDTNTGDKAELGPYHVARILTTPFARFSVSVLAFDTITSATGGETFSFLARFPPDPDVPKPSEPTGGLLGGIGVLTCMVVRRSRR